MRTTMKALNEYTWAERVAVAILSANEVYEAPADEETKALMPEGGIDFPDLCKWLFAADDPEKVRVQTLVAAGFIGPKKEIPKPEVVDASLPTFIPDCKDAVAAIKGSKGFTWDEIIDV